MNAGTLPFDFTASATSLFSLLGSQNELSGVLPEWGFKPTSDSSLRRNQLNRTLSANYLMFSSNRLSGTLSNRLCSFQNLRGFSFVSQFMSGTIPSCLGHLTNLGVMAFARNYHTGRLPQSLNSLSSLRTIILASNRLKCEAPGLDKSTGLGTGAFQGIIYPCKCTRF